MHLSVAELLEALLSFHLAFTDTNKRQWFTPVAQKMRCNSLFPEDLDQTQRRGKKGINQEE